MTCVKCGHQNWSGARFCGACGSSQYSGDTAVASGLPAGGERKQATVLFSDIVGSTELVAGLDPEQAMEHLRPAVSTMREVVPRFGGLVVNTLGDGIMAVFGAPRAQEGHALLACQAALAMREAFMQRHAALRLRIGLHSGEVISDAPVPELGKEQSVHGSTIHLASRLQSMAEPGGICITGDCYRLVQSCCEALPLGRQVVRGFPEPIEIFSLVATRPLAAGRPFRSANLTSFRGRDREIAALRQALQATDAADTRVVGISGAPGTGKSRLCYEFANWCRGRSIPVLEVRALLYGHATPLQPVLELFRSLFGISSTDEIIVARGRIARHIMAIGPTFEPDLPLLYDFLGLGDDARPPPQPNPNIRHARLLDIVRHMVRQRGTTTSVIIVEDLHWFDEASEAFIGAIVDSVAGTRTMLVLNYRSSYAASWMESLYCQQLLLAELRLDETEALVKELIGDRPELQEICQRIADRSGGNPFFAEELVRSLAENSALCGESGNYVLGFRSDVHTLPATVQVVIGERIDRLGEIEKVLLQVAAIIGEEFPLPVLEQVATLPVEQIENALNHMCDAGLIQRLPSADDQLFGFRHPLIQEVAYVSQLKARRSALHASVAKAMERFYKDRLDELSGLLAYHYEAAGQATDSANYAARAAMWVGSTHCAQAIKHWQKVRSLLRDGPRSQSSDALRIMASGQIAWLGWREGLTADEAKPFIEEALGWARDTDHSMVPLLLFVDGRITVASGGPADKYVERVKEALSLVRQDTDRGRIATLNTSLSQAYGWAGLLNEALAANTAALEGLSYFGRFDQEFLGYSVEHWAMSLRGRILIRLGRFSEAENCLTALLGIEETLLDPTVRFIPHLGYVDIAWCQGDATLADQHASQVAELAARHGFPYLRVFALACSGTAKTLKKDLTGAIEDFNEALGLLRRTKAAMEYEPEILSSLAECYYRTREFHRAAATASHALDIARRRSARLPECRASITYAGAILAGGDTARRHEAEILLSQADELIQLTGARIYEPLLTEQRSRMLYSTC